MMICMITFFSLNKLAHRHRQKKTSRIDNGTVLTTRKRKHHHHPTTHTHTRMHVSTLAGFETDRNDCQTHELLITCTVHLHTEALRKSTHTHTHKTPKESQNPQIRRGPHNGPPPAHRRNEVPHTHTHANTPTHTRTQRALK